MNTSATSRHDEFWAGVRAELPLQLGVAPFGLVFGVLGLASGLSAWETILMSSIVFGGASQVVFAQLWGGGVPAPVVGASVSVINLRHVLYSASVAPYLRSLPLRWRVPLASPRTPNTRPNGVTPSCSGSSAWTPAQNS